MKAISLNAIVALLAMAIFAAAGVVAFLRSRQRRREVKYGLEIDPMTQMLDRSDR